MIQNSVAVGWKKRSVSTKWIVSEDWWIRYALSTLHFGSGSSGLGNPISYSQALARSLKVWWRGLGIGFPIVALITEVIAYERLKRYGNTSWDREGNFVVAHEKIGTARILVAIAFFIVFLVFVAIMKLSER